MVLELFEKVTEQFVGTDEALGQDDIEYSLLGMLLYI